jgi:hypothetical protein
MHDLTALFYTIDSLFSVAGSFFICCDDSERSSGHCHIIGNSMRWIFHFAISCRGDDFVPCLHRRGPKVSMRSCRCEMTLDVEGVVDCRMH